MITNGKTRQKYQESQTLEVENSPLRIDLGKSADVGFLCGPSAIRMHRLFFSQETLFFAALRNYDST